MKDDSEERLALGEQADHLGLILTVVGEEYQLHASRADHEQPEFASPHLTEVKDYLDRLQTDHTGN